MRDGPFHPDGSVVTYRILARCLAQVLGRFQSTCLLKPRACLGVGGYEYLRPLLFVGLSVSVCVRLHVHALVRFRAKVCAAQHGMQKSGSFHFHFCCPYCPLQ